MSKIWLDVQLGGFSTMPPLVVDTSTWTLEDWALWTDVMNPEARIAWAEYYFASTRAASPKEFCDITQLGVSNNKFSDTM